jgi:hypothetical protein
MASCFRIVFQTVRADRRRLEQRAEGKSTMAAKKNAIERTLRKAQSVLASYIKPGRRTAEASIDELLRVLHDTRVTLMRTVKKTTGTRTRRRSTSRARVSTAKRRPAAAASRKRATVKSKARARSKRGSR